MIKIRLKKAGFIISVCALTWAFSEKPGGAEGSDVKANAMAKGAIPKKGSDSLAALKVILRSEFEAKNKILIFRNRDFSDSLLHSGYNESVLKNAISDSSILREIKSKGEFNRYWKRVEAENGITELRSQLHAEDVDKTLIPKVYLVDSSIVVYPGWVIIRKKPHRSTGRLP